MLDALTDNPHGCDGAPLGLGPVECGRLPWHVVRYNGGDHALVRAALHRLGVTTFLPLVRVSIPDRRLVQRVATVPAFRGCLFVQWRSGFDWGRILSQPGVLAGPAGLIRPVGDPYGHPQAVPDADMDDLLASASDGGVISDDTAPPPRARKRRWKRLGDLDTVQRLALLDEIMGATRTVTARRRDVEAL